LAFIESHESLLVKIVKNKGYEEPGERGNGGTGKNRVGL